VIIPIVGAPVHLTEMSSMWKQLWLPQPLCGHDAMSVSIPRHWTLSNQICPLPGLTCPRERPEYLYVIINHKWLSSTTLYVVITIQYRLVTASHPRSATAARLRTKFGEHLYARRFSAWKKLPRHIVRFLWSVYRSPIFLDFLLGTLPNQRRRWRVWNAK